MNQVVSPQHGTAQAPRVSPPSAQALVGLSSLSHVLLYKHFVGITTSLPPVESCVRPPLLSAARKAVILVGRNEEAGPPMPMALTVLEIGQYVETPRV